MNLLFSLFLFSSSHSGYVCFISDVFVPECGTIGHSTSKKVAKAAAFKLCREYGGGPCQLDYCEKK